MHSIASRILPLCVLPLSLVAIACDPIWTLRLYNNTPAPIEVVGRVDTSGLNNRALAPGTEGRTSIERDGNTYHYFLLPASEWQPLGSLFLHKGDSTCIYYSDLELRMPGDTLHWHSRSEIYRHAVDTDSWITKIYITPSTK